jgi:acyl-coenzyme A thioesterase 9
MRYGKLFEILDSLAADVAMRHAGGRLLPSPGVGGAGARDAFSVTIVTAAIDKMYIYRDVDVLSDVVLRAYVGHVGSSSMEVCIDILGQNDEMLARTTFIMAARDPVKGGPHRLPPLDADTAAGRHGYLQGELRARLRKERRASSLASLAPNSSETELIHSLYLQSVALKQQKDDMIKAAMKRSGPAPTPGPGPVRALVASNIRWMKDTVFRNAYYMYPQDRNMHGNIFGGHILRRAFEAARVSASIFFGSEENISFRAVDEIHFVKPVPVGSIVEFTSTVSYSEMTMCVVNVTAATVDVASGIKDVTNSFNYMFSVPVEFVDRNHLLANSIICSGDSEGKGKGKGKSPCVLKVDDFAELSAGEGPWKEKGAETGAGLMKLPRVVPREYYEIVHYLEGRRSLRHMLQLRDAGIREGLAPTPEEVGGEHEHAHAPSEEEDMVTV